MRAIPVTAAATAAAICIGAGALAHDAKDPRHIAMEALGKHMKAIGQVVKNDGPVPDTTIESAQTIAITAQRMLDLFPAGSGGERSRAKEAIWQNWDDFKAASRNFTDAAASLVTAARSGERDAIGAALAATGKTCKGCHQNYRKPKQH
jgi:cytochrome c556